MLVSELVSLQKSFVPAVDLENEQESYWERFIPIDSFNVILKALIKSIQSKDIHERQSIWVQGRYGTGKSHAAITIKHLLSDPQDRTHNYCTNVIDDNELKALLKTVRNKHRVLPVLLKGTTNIFDLRSFNLAIEKAVVKALNDSNIAISTKSDFAKHIDYLRTMQPSQGWDEFIQSNIDLSQYVANQKDLTLKLQQEDVQVLRALENALSSIQVMISHTNISQWLKEVIGEVRNTTDYTDVLIFWDEATHLLELVNSDHYVKELQGIADLAASNGIYLYMISHRNIEQLRSSISSDVLQTVMGRFKQLNYEMSSITTYQIMNASICKNRSPEYNAITNSFKETHDGLVRIISDQSLDIKASDQLTGLWPFHPYTVFLCSYIVENIGSTERSVFKYLYDDKKGFKGYIDSQEVSDVSVITADHLWEYFIDDFLNNESSNYITVLTQWDLHKDAVTNAGNEYLKVFEGILLLNALHRSSLYIHQDKSLTAPNLKNIKLMFSGTSLENEVETVIEFLDKNQIIYRNPNGLLLISNMSISPSELEGYRSQIEDHYKKNDSIVLSILESKLPKITSLINEPTYRPVEVLFLDAKYSINHTRSKVFGKGAFSLMHSIHIVFIISQSVAYLQSIENTVETLLQEDGAQNVVIVVLDKLLDDKSIDKYIEIKAREEAARVHNYKDDHAAYKRNADDIVDKWIQDVRNSYLTIHYFVPGQGLTKYQVLLSAFGQSINNRIAPIIFNKGFDILAHKTTKSIWEPKKAKQAASNFLASPTLSDVVEKCSGVYGSLKVIVQSKNDQYIVDENLNLLKNFEHHPTCFVSMSIDEKLASLQGATSFELAELISFFREPPYGYFGNTITYALLGFVLRKFAGVFYEVGKGVPIDSARMLELIERIFKYWEASSSQVYSFPIRLGSPEENKLCSLLVDIFDLESVKGIQNTRWKIREWINNVGYPIWIYKTCNPMIEKTIENLASFVQSTDVDITNSDIVILLNDLEALSFEIKEALQQDASALFQKWIISVHPNYANSDLGLILSYVKQKMPESIDVYGWNEDKVRIAVLEYSLEAGIKSADNENGNNSIDVSGEGGNESRNRGDSTQQSVFVSSLQKDKAIQIVQYKQSEFVEIMTAIFERFPGTITYILERYSEK